MFCSRFLPHEIEVVRGSLVDATREGGGTYGSCTMQLEERLARPETSEPYPDLESSPELVSSSLPEFWP